MDSRALLVLLALAAAGDALSPANFRDAVRSLKKASWPRGEHWLSSASRSSLSLLAEEPTAEAVSASPGPSTGESTDEEDGMNPHSPDFPWELECTESIALFEFMNTTGCLDENGDLIGNRPGREVDPEEFCSTCDIQYLYEEASTLPPSCYSYDINGTESPAFLYWYIRVIVPVYGTICTQGSNGDYCAAPLFLTFFGEEDKDPSGESQVDWKALFENTCDPNCPFWDTMLQFSFDCSLELSLFGSLCIFDYGDMCVGTMSNLIDDVHSSETGRPDPYSVMEFCDRPCGGALIEFWDDEYMRIPECKSDLYPSSIDPSWLCLRRQGDREYCVSSVVPQVDEVTLDSCNFTGEVAEWDCEGVCRTTVQQVVDTVGCCSELFFLDHFSEMEMSGVEHWVTDTCQLSVDADECTDAYTKPSERPECWAFRESRLSVLEGITCMVQHRHSSMASP